MPRSKPKTITVTFTFGEQPHGRKGRSSVAFACDGKPGIGGEGMPGVKSAARMLRTLGKHFLPLVEPKS